MHAIMELHCWYWNLAHTFKIRDVSNNFITDTKVINFKCIFQIEIASTVKVSISAPSWFKNQCYSQGSYKASFSLLVLSNDKAFSVYQQVHTLIKMNRIAILRTT